MPYGPLRNALLHYLAISDLRNTDFSIFDTKPVILFCNFSQLAAKFCASWEHLEPINEHFWFKKYIFLNATRHKVLHLFVVVLGAVLFS